jgi:hypothetical protein
MSAWRLAALCAALCASLWQVTAFAADAPRNLAYPIEPGAMPARVHVFEDYETEIEKRWWLRGAATRDNLAPSLSSIPNRRACRAAPTKDFDDKQGDPAKNWKAVIFNPVPGPPMGPQTHLSFRYWLKGTGTLRVQIYSLSNGYHRHLTLTDLPQGAWQSATVDMTAARRPDGTGGPLAADERIDDIQFYIAPDAELLIDDIVLYEPAPASEREPFASRVIFTGWFDTGKQGAEWPGDFEIITHEPPKAWKCAKSVPNATTREPWIRVHLRGPRPLGETTRLRFQYHVSTGPLRVTLANSATRQQWTAALEEVVTGQWDEASLTFATGKAATADELHFLPAPGAILRVDNVLLHEPAQ